MNGNSQTLELQIKSKAQEAIYSVDKLINEIGIAGNSVDRVTSKIDRNGNKTTQILSTIEKKGQGIYKILQQIDKDGNLSTISTSFNSLKKITDKENISANNLSKTLKNIFTFAGVKKLTVSALSWMNEAIDYTEQLNLFNVVFDNTEKNGKQMFSELGKSALQFQYKLNEAFGTNKTQTLYMQGIFQSMGETVGIKDNYSAIMSETMTKLTYDLASLYNKTENATAEAIRAGVYAGQTKPLRSYGIDVTQSSLQPIAESLGITESVKNMSQAEKEILRYLATMKQAKIAMGDLANTIESPSNQLKVFRQQLIETKTAFSSLFIGALSNALPYANAILMVIKEVSKAIADMFGIELRDYNAGIASQEGLYDGIADSAEDASGAVKELKRQTLGFDEIHNINENNNSGSGTSVNGGIDQRLLDAIQGYDNGMDKVRMKATEIRDKWMEILGFHKEVDPLTGEISFKYEGIKTTLKNVWNWFKKLNAQGKILVGLGLVIGITKLLNGAKKLTVALGASGLLSPLKKLISPMNSLYKSLNDINFANKSLVEGLGEGISNWSKSLTMLDKFKVGLIGIIGLSLSMEGMKSAMHSVSEEGWNLGNSLQTVISGLGGIASGAYIGSIFGPWGTVIGGATGAVLNLTTALLNYENQGYKTASSIMKSIEATNEYSDSLLKQYNSIAESTSKEVALTTAYSNLISELESLVDANGRVKNGYKERAEFIVTTLNQAYGTELTITDGKIQKMDEEIKKIRDVISEKKKQIALESASKAYEIALNEKVKSYQNLEEATSDYNNAVMEQNRYESKLRQTYEKYKNSYYQQYTTYEKFLESMSKSEIGYKKIIATTNEAKKAMDNATIAYDANTMAIMQYQGLLSADAQENSELVDYYMNQIENTYYDGEKAIKLTYDQQIKDAQEYYNSVIRTTKSNGQEITDEIKAQAESRLNSITTELINQSNTVKEMTPEIVSAWATLGNSNKDKFLEKFKELPNDIQQEIVNKMQSQGYRISDELQKGINQINPTITIKADTSSANNTLNSFNSKLVSKINEWQRNAIFNIKSLIGVSTGGVYSNGSWKDIPQYANGGSPTHGTMFVAGEAGAEIVGHINGKTEVLNQSQIASAIYSAVYSAMSQFNGGGVAEINVHASKDVIVETAINGINQQTNQTGVCPVIIPVY